MAQPREVIKNFDAQGEMKEAITENLNNMMRLAESKAEVFVHEIYDSIRTSGGQENKKVPVSSIIDDKRAIRCYSKKENSSISNVVTDVVGSFMRGSAEGVLTGVCQLITGALDIFLGEGYGETGQMSDYYIASTGKSLVRIDMRAWYLNTTTSALTKHTEKVLAVVAVKSVVDLSKIDLNTFIYFYQDQMGTTSQSVDEFKEQINEIKEIYKLFRPQTDETFRSGTPNNKESIAVKPNSYLSSRSIKSHDKSGISEDMKELISQLKDVLKKLSMIVKKL